MQYHRLLDRFREIFSEPLVHHTVSNHHLKAMFKAWCNISNGVPFSLHSMGHLRSLMDHYNNYRILHASESSDRSRITRIEPVVDCGQVFYSEPCCLCLDSLQDPLVLKRCGHVFCKVCLETLFQSSFPSQPKCPKCRMKLPCVLERESKPFTSTTEEAPEQRSDAPLGSTARPVLFNKVEFLTLQVLFNRVHVPEAAPSVDMDDSETIVIHAKRRALERLLLRAENGEWDQVDMV